jgi:hypothetical protein
MQRVREKTKEEKRMIITDITFTTPALTPIANNLWQLASDTRITVNMPANKGYRFLLLKGFITNLRSGSDFLNFYIPRMGDEGRTLAYALHDALYTWLKGLHKMYHLLDKEIADMLLKLFLAECDAMNRNQISDLQEVLKANEKYYDNTQKALVKNQIKALEKEILGNFKISAIYKAVKWFGGSAYNKPNPYPYDKNADKIFMEVL